MYKGILVYKGTSLAEKTAILPTQVRRKIEFTKIEFIIKERLTLSQFFWQTFVGYYWGLGLLSFWQQLRRSRTAQLYCAFEI